MTDLDKLEAIAKAMLPVWPWEAGTALSYIANFDPETILKLIAVARAASKQMELCPSTISPAVRDALAALGKEPPT